MDLNELIERERIRDVIYRYCEAVDAKDWVKVMASFTEDATISHGSYDGPADKFLGFIQDILNKMTKTVHSIGGTVISIDGNRAKISTTFSSFHQVSGEYAQVGPVKTGGVDTDWIVAGRYVDNLIKVKGEWKIKNRQASNDWTCVQPSNPS